MISDNHNNTGLQHSLKQRHMSMIAIGGVIGAGLFVGSGVIAKAAGPAAILSFLLTGGLVVLIMRMLGELASSLPVVGSFYEYARLAFDDKPKVSKFLGFMSGWMYWYFWVVVVALEAIAGAKLVNFWLPDVPSWAISLVLLVYGVGGILGAVVGGRAADRWPRPHTFVVFLVLHGLATSVLPLATVSLWVLLVAVVAWCIFNMAPGPAIQKYLVGLNPNTAAVQISLNTSAIQLGVALGAFLGAGLVDHFSVQALPWVGAALVLGGAGCGWWSARLPKTQDND